MNPTLIDDSAIQTEIANEWIILIKCVKNVKKQATCCGFWFWGRSRLCANSKRITKSWRFGPWRAEGRQIVDRDRPGEGFETIAGSRWYFCHDEWGGQLLEQKAKSWLTSKACTTQTRWNKQTQRNREFYSLDFKSGLGSLRKYFQRGFSCYLEDEAEVSGDREGQICGVDLHTRTCKNRQRPSTRALAAEKNDGQQRTWWLGSVNCGQRQKC